MDSPATGQNKSNSGGTQQGVPETWPGGFGIYQYSKRAVMLNLDTFLILFIIELVIVFVLERFLGILGSLLADLASVAISVVTTIVSLESVRGRKLSISDAISKVTPSLFINYLITVILAGIICGVALILFIIPFFFVAPRFLLLPYYVVDKNLGPGDAIKASWEGSKGNVGKIWGIIGVLIVFGILCLVLIGIYFSFMYSVAATILYLFLQKRGTQPVAPAQSAPLPPA